MHQNDTRVSSFPSASQRPSRLLLGAMAAGAFALLSNCGGGGSQRTPPSPDVQVDVNTQLVDVGERFELDASRTTDPNGNFEDMTFQWRFVGGDDDLRFEDHCRLDFEQICDENADDHCSNDENRFCNTDEDCEDFGTCTLNSGTSSPDCTEGICGLEEGDEGVRATFVAESAGPFQVRVTAIGNESNGTATLILDTFPSLFVVDGLHEFGGTEGAYVRTIDQEGLDEISEGASDPENGNLLVIDDDLGLVRVFDLHTGELLGAFGESDRFVDEPAALAFHPQTNELFVAEASGDVLVFDDESGLLLRSFGNVGANPVSMTFTPGGDLLLVVFGTPGTGVRAFQADDGQAEGVLGNTDGTAGTPVDLDFVGDTLLVADSTGRVVACDEDGFGCESFSNQLDSLLAAGSPSAIAVNPSRSFTGNDVLVADPVGGRVIACNDSGASCATFGETDERDSSFADIFFSPDATPTTTTTSTTTTTLGN